MGSQGRGERGAPGDGAARRQAGAGASQPVWGCVVVAFCWFVFSYKSPPSVPGFLPLTQRRLHPDHLLSACPARCLYGTR